MITLYDLRKIQDDRLIEDIQTHFFESETATINVIRFSDQSINACIGCWNCWLKTPGKCVMNDSMSSHYEDYINSDKVILLMDTAQGFIDHTAKAFLDRTIALYHPYIEIVNNECHHWARYDKYPVMYFFYNTGSLSASETTILEDYLARSAYHYKSKPFLIYNNEVLEIKPLKYADAKRHQIPFAATEQIEKLIIYNGSPRRIGSNSAIILNQVEQELAEKVEIRDLKQSDNWAKWAESFSSEENVLFFMPLYVHAMPSHVMNFLELLKPSIGSIGFFVQSGFPESSQSHFLEAYFEQLSIRLSRKYLGTAIKGGVESLQTSPIESQEKTIDSIVQTLSRLVKAGSFDHSDINRLAMPVRFGRVIGKLVHVFGKKSINSFWDKKLIANNAYENRFDHPYLK